jgi:hypothetical protein
MRIVRDIPSPATPYRICDVWDVLYTHFQKHIFWGWHVAIQSKGEAGILEGYLLFGHTLHEDCVASKGFRI